VNTPRESVHQKFTAALDRLIEQVKADRSILAAILCGSLSHDTVWDKSDIGLALISIDDKKVERSGLSLYADGVNIHAFLPPTTRRIPQDGGRRRSQLFRPLDVRQGPPRLGGREGLSNEDLDRFIAGFPVEAA
jgi:hypothetical protein